MSTSSGRFAWYPTDRSGRCVMTNPAGFQFEEFTCLYPLWRKTYLPFELSYSPVALRDWMVANPWVPVAAVILYAVGIYFGQAYFASRPAWNLRSAMALWNLGLSLFSFWGLSRTLPVLIFNHAHYSFLENACMDPENQFGSGTEGAWAQFFVLSKFPELFDTFFIVVHKKPLLFLHWYHHITVLLFSWFAYVVKAHGIGPFFIVMNYAVHAVMYFYYFLMAVKAKPKWFNPEWITMAQISQMIAGVLLVAYGWYLMLVLKPEGCYISYASQVSGLLMYGSYLLLFLQFFWKRYTVPADGQKKGSKSE